jgi:sporulation protein YlmC with PRC-barrel domain
MNSTDGNGKVGSWNPNMYGEVVVDRSNRRIGKIETFAVDEKQLAPEWLVVKTSRFGRRRLVPLQDAQQDGDVVRVPFSKNLVVAAPVPDPPFSLSRSDQIALARHYLLAA